MSFIRCSNIGSILPEEGGMWRVECYEDRSLAIVFDVKGELAINLFVGLKDRVIPSPPSSENQEYVEYGPYEDGEFDRYWRTIQTTESLARWLTYVRDCGGELDTGPDSLCAWWNDGLLRLRGPELEQWLK